MKTTVLNLLFASASAEFGVWTDYSYCDFNQKEVELY